MTWPNHSTLDRDDPAQRQRVTSPRTFYSPAPPRELLAAAGTGPTARNTTPLHRRRDRRVHLRPQPPFSSLPTRAAAAAEFRADGRFFRRVGSRQRRGGRGGGFTARPVEGGRWRLSAPGAHRLRLQPATAKLEEI